MAAGATTNWLNVHRINPYVSSSGSEVTFSLDSAYVHGVSGDAWAVRYMCPTSDPINELYFHCGGVTGTLNNLLMACDIYNEGVAALVPGSTIRDSHTVFTSPSAANDRWGKFEFGTPYTPVVGEILWFIVHNTSVAPTVDYPGILQSSSIIYSNAVFTNQPFMSLTTTAGFSVSGTAVPESPLIVKQGNNYFGMPFTSANSSPFVATTLRRGMKVVPPITVQVYGISFSTNVAYGSIEIYNSATAPGGSPLHTIPLGSVANLLRDRLSGFRWFDTPITLYGGQTYYVVVTFESASTTPSTHIIDDYVAFPTVFDAMYDNFSVCPLVIDDGAGGWTVDKSMCPAMSLVVSGYGSGGGSSVGGLNFYNRGSFYG